MKARLLNSTRIEGILYQHNLELKVSGPNSKKPGTEFISGTIDIATNDAMTNIVPVHFTYVTATTATGKENATFGTLKNIIDKKIGCYTDPEVGDNAAKLRVDSAIGLNEFYSDRTGAEELVSVKRNEGGFVHIVQNVAASEGLRDTFIADMIITKTIRQEADPDNNKEEKMIVSGYVFDFRNALLPVDFMVYAPAGMDMFESFDASEKNPVFVEVQGHQVSKTVTRTRISESSGGWGEPVAQEVTSSQREFVISRVSDPYDWDTEETITATEYQAALQAREVVKAEIKQRQDEYNATRAQTQTPTATPAGGANGFNF